MPVSSGHAFCAMCQLCGSRAMNGLASGRIALSGHGFRVSRSPWDMSATLIDRLQYPQLALAAGYADFAFAWVTSRRCLGIAAGERVEITPGAGLAAW
jgi:hypothetical protein